MRLPILILALSAILFADASAGNFYHGHLTPKKVTVKDSFTSHGPITASTVSMDISTVTADDITSTGTHTAAAITASGLVKSTHATYKLAKAWIPWQSFVSSNVSPTFGVFGAGDAVSSAELNSSGLAGLLVGANSDEFACLWPLPQDFDPAGAITFKIVQHFDVASETGDSVAWALSFKALTYGTSTLADATTAASPQFSACAWAADNAVHIASGATIAGATLTTENALILEFIPTLTNFSADEISVLGVEVTYTKLHL